MLNSGMGETHVTSFLATMEIQGMSPNAFKKQERELSEHIEEVAKQSCLKIIELEKQLSEHR